MRFVARHGGSEIPIEVERQGSGYIVRMGDRVLPIDLTPAGPFVHSLRFEDGTQFSLTHHRTHNQHEVTVSGVKIVVEIVDPLALKRGNRSEAAGEAGVVKALMPGRIVRVDVAKGDTVRKGAPLLVLEAMKMQNEIQAPSEGTVEDVFVKTGDTVEGGAALVHIV